MANLGSATPYTRHGLESRAPRLAILEPQREADWPGCGGKGQEVVVQDE